MAASSAPARSNGMDLERVEALLLERLAALEAAARGLEPAEAVETATDSAELGTELSAHDVDFSCRESIGREMTEIGEALARVREGRYGLCEGCGDAMSPERLEAIPYATLCLACKTAEEARWTG
jgi:RNA polymerase-binding transcription factor DksA